MIELKGGKTISVGKNGVDTHTTYSNGSNYQRYNPQGHATDPTPHGHGHLQGTGPYTERLRSFHRSTGKCRSLE